MSTVTACDIIEGAEAYLSKRGRWISGSWAVVERGVHAGKGFGGRFAEAKAFVREYPDVNPCCCAEGACLLIGARLGADGRTTRAAIRMLDAEVKAERAKLPPAKQSYAPRSIMDVNDEYSRTARGKVMKFFRRVKEGTCAK